MGWCEAQAEIYADGLESDSQALRLHGDLLLDLHASFGEVKIGKTQEGVGSVSLYDCSGTGDCIFEQLEKMGLIDKAVFRGVCAKDPNRKTINKG